MVSNELWESVTATDFRLPETKAWNAAGQGLFENDDGNLDCADGGKEDPSGDRLDLDMDDPRPLKRRRLDQVSAGVSGLSNLHRP